MSRPAAIATASVTPLACTGVARVVTVPSPSWPLELYPQSQTVPLLHSATVLLCPASTAFTVPDEHGTVTFTGSDLLALVALSPSWPCRSLPQV
jgi:type IV secretory pathway protease TraF